MAPNWFGVAIPNPDTFDLHSDVYVVLYFHPIPGQAGYLDSDYPAKTGQFGTDWKQLYGYIDRLGGQMAGAIQAGGPANRLVIFPFLTNAQYSLDINEWFNVIHDILQDINNTNVVKGICTKPKKMIVASISNGSFYLNQFLVDADTSGNSNYNNIIEVWDFDSDITTNPNILVKPREKPLRAYWQNQIPQITTNAPQFSIQLPPTTSWTNFPDPPPPEIPPLPPNASNSKSSPDPDPVTSPGADPITKFHHYIRDTMFLDAVLNIENDNPNP